MVGSQASTLLARRKSAELSSRFDAALNDCLPHKIEAHASIAVLALLLERMAEPACGDTWRNIRDRRKRIQLAQSLGGKKTVWHATGPTKEARKMLKRMKLDESAPILRID